MTDREKFTGFKQKLVAENEEEYGAEIRAKYGEEAVNHSNEKILHMSQQEYAQISALSAQLMDTLLAAYKTGDPADALAQQAADLHRKWLTFYWGRYSKEAHAGVAQMYVDDARFTAYYDQHQPGLAAFLRDAVFCYTGTEKKTE